MLTTIYINNVQTKQKWFLHIFVMLVLYYSIFCLTSLEGRLMTFTSSFFEPSFSIQSWRGLSRYTDIQYKLFTWTWMYKCRCGCFKSRKLESHSQAAQVHSQKNRLDVSLSKYLQTALQIKGRVSVSAEGLLIFELN